MLCLLNWVLLMRGNALKGWFVVIPCLGSALSCVPSSSAVSPVQVAEPNGDEARRSSKGLVESGAGRQKPYLHDDSNVPDYYVERIDDPHQHPTAILRLKGFFQQAMTQAAGNREAPQVRTLLDLIVPPLTELYTKGSKLRPDTERLLLELLCDTQDPRAKTAWIKSLEQPRWGELSHRVFQAIVHSGCRDHDVLQAMMRAFLRFEEGAPKCTPHTREVREAMLAISSPTWEGALIESLKQPMDKPTLEEDRKNDEKLRNIATKSFGRRLLLKS